MAIENIYRDSKIVKVIAAEAKKDRIDANDRENADKIVSELVNDFNPHNRYLLAQLMAYTVSEIIKPETDFLANVADEVSVPYGAKAAFKVRKDGIRAVIQAKGATTPRSKVSNKQVVLDTVAVSARPTINIVELRAGRVQMSDLVTEAAREMANKKLEYIEDVFRSGITSWNAPFYGTGAGVVSTTIDPMIQHWMRVGGCAIFGDIYVIQKLAEQTGFTASTTTQQFSTDIINEFNTTGKIGTYKGAQVVQMVNAYKDDGTTPLLNQKTLYLLPVAADKASRALKVVHEGDVMSNDFTDIDDLSYQVRLDQYFGAGIVLGNTPSMSAYVDSTT